MNKRPDINTKSIPANAKFVRMESQFAEVEAGEGEKSKFRLTAYKGQIFSHWYWGQLAFDISGMRMAKDVIPALRDHNSDKIVGAIDSGSFKDAIVFEGEFEDTAHAQEIRATKKLKWESSLAFDMGSAVIEEVGRDATVEVNGQQFKGPGFVVREAAIYEVSFTLFGAAPETEAETFGQGEKTINVSINRKDSVMTQEEKDQAEKNGRENSVGLFKKMKELCPNDPAFVAEQYEAGVSIEEFTASLNAKIAKENAELKAENEKLKASKAGKPEGEGDEGRDPLTFAGREHGQKGKGTFMEQAKAYAEEHKCSMTTAFSRVASVDPEAYEKHLESCPRNMTRRVSR